MSRSGAPTVAILKEQLNRYGLATTGRKADLENRLAEHLEQLEIERANAPPAPPASYQGMNQDIQRMISNAALRNTFYLSDKMNVLKELQDKEGLKEGIYPTILGWWVTKQRPTEMVVSSKAELERQMAERLATPGLKEITMKRDHLSVIVSFNSSRLDVQILLFYPGIKPSAYTLTIRGSIRYDPSAQSASGSKKPYIFISAKLFHRFNREWTLAQRSVENGKKAIKDLMLGIHWIQTFVLPNKAKLSSLVVEDMIQYVWDDLTGDPLNRPENKKDTDTLRKFFKTQLFRVLPKARS